MATQALDLAPTNSTECHGFASDIYDRYVLGLLDAAERNNVERELAGECPDCVAGVQRSINLWLVFAGSLQQVEPSADFRGRLIRIAELSNRVLTVPKRDKHRPAVLFSSLLIACLILALLLLFTFIAGRQSSRLELQRVKNEFVNLRSDAAESQVKLQQENDRYREAQQNLKRPNAVAFKDMQDELTRLRSEKIRYEAAIQSFRDGLERDTQRTHENSTLVSALQSPGVRLLTFKSQEGASSTAYAFVIENAKVLFVASKMPVLPGDRQYQLWLVRKTGRSFLSLGVFSSQADVPEVLTYDEDTNAIADLAGLLVTEEHVNGSAEPSATRILETPGVAAVATPSPTEQGTSDVPIF